jgi:hypothetical protein
LHLYSLRRDEVVHESGGLRYRIVNGRAGPSCRHPEVFRDCPLRPLSDWLRSLVAENPMAAVAEERTVQAVCLERRFSGEEQVCCGNDFGSRGITATPDHFADRSIPDTDVR